MDKRILGDGLEVSAIGLGCMGMSRGFGPSGPKAEMIAVIRAAVERGVTFFDTAEAYGRQRGTGRRGSGAVRADQVVIATKFGFKLGATATSRGWTAVPNTIKEVADNSLRRLGTDEHRPALPTPRRPGRADRGRRRNGEGTDPRAAR